MKRKLLFEVSIVIGGLLLIFSIIAPVIWPPGTAQARQELLHLSKGIKLGNTRAQVSTLYSKGGYKWLRRNIAGQELQGNNYISTPLSVLASNWVLLVKFKNDKVGAVLFRTSDGGSRKPPDTPPDLRE